jgi:hypothetical protein
MMFRIILNILFILACWRWGDWKRWREFYPTILYFIIGDLAYNFIFYKNSFWEYRGLYNHTFSDFLDAFVEFPCTVILYLTYYPKKYWKQACYILLWVCIYTLIELVSWKTSNFLYFNGWNIFWTIAFNCTMFTLLKLHYKRPIIVWPISAVFVVLTMIIFKVPFNSLK